MDLTSELHELCGPDPTRRQTAADKLVAAGADAVPMLLAALTDDAWDRVSHVVVDVLGRIGEPAFAPLVTTIAQATTWSTVARAGQVVAGLRTPGMTRHLAALRHESANVRDRVVLAFEGLGPDAVPYADALLPLLGDPADHVRGRAEMAFRRMGREVIPWLRQVRRSTGRKDRRYALTALAEAGGWAALDDTDRALLRRLIRAKLCHEVPEPMHLCGDWYAVPTTDQPAVLDALGLSDAEPVTMRLGEAAWHHDHHSPDAEPGARVYVTPAFDGWTLVFGRPVESDVKRFTASLSRRFGAAHWYYEFEGCTGWCLAEAGDVIRYYDNENPDDAVGPPHPAEHGRLLPHEDPFPDDAFDDLPLGDTGAFGARYRQLKQDLAIPDSCWASDVAARASVDPAQLGQHTRVTGHGVLALTALGRRDGTAPGALPI